MSVNNKNLAASAGKGWKHREISVLIVVLGLWSAYFVNRSASVGIEGKTYHTLFDNAMVSMRYALNLVQGHGLVWNAGEYVEGYSNPLYTLMMAGCIAIFGKVQAPLAVQILGAAFLLMGVVFTYLFARRIAETFEDGSQSFKH